MNSVIRAACIQAAAVLVAARNAASNSLIIDVEACVKLTEELYEKATGEKYERSSGGGAQNPLGRADAG
jgi:hypothetical protein